MNDVYYTLRSWESKYIFYCYFHLQMSEDMSSPSLEQSVTMDATTGLTSEDYDMAQAEYWCSDEPGEKQCFNQLD